jgi:hypothetical protein
VSRWDGGELGVGGPGYVSGCLESVELNALWRDAGWGVGVRGPE